MKTFNLSLPTIGERNPKVHMIDQDDFKKALVDFPRELAESMVELGYGKWVPTTNVLTVPVPQALIHPEQILFVRSPTRTVKACHVNSLVEEVGPVPASLVGFCHNIKEDIFFEHDEKDLEGMTYNEEDTLYELLEGSVDVSPGGPFEHDPKDLEDPKFNEEDDQAEAIDAVDMAELVKTSTAKKSPEPNKPINKVAEALKADKEKKEEAEKKEDEKDDGPTDGTVEETKDESPTEKK